MEWMPFVVALLVAIAAASVLAPGVAALVRWPTRYVLLVIIDGGIVGCLLYGSARWATFGRAFERQPAMAYLLLAGVAFIALAFFTLTRKSSDQTAVVVARLASLLPIAALSLPPGDGYPSWRGDLIDRLAASAAAGNHTLTATLVYDLVPNALLYLPPGLLWASALGSCRRTVFTFTASSVLVELYQAAFTDRVCQLADVLGNGLGAALGAVLYVTLRRLGPSRADPSVAPVVNGPSGCSAACDGRVQGP